MLRNLFSLGFSNIFAQLFAFLFITYYTRTLSKDLVGVINLSQAILVYFTMMTLYGLQTYGTKEVAKNKDDKGKIQSLVGNIIGLRLIIAMISFLLIILIAIFANKGTVFTYVLIIYGITLFPIAFNIDWFYSGISEMQYNARYNIVKSIIPVIILVLFLNGDEKFYIIPIGTFMGMLMASIYHLIVYRKKSYELTIKFKPHSNIYYLKAAFPFFLSGMLSMINCNVDTIIIGFLRSDSELALYSTGYKIIFFLISLISIIYIPIFPNLISYYSNKEFEKLKELLSYLSKIIVMIAVPIFIGSIMLSKEIIVFLFKERYLDSYVSFNILSFYILILFFREIYAYSLNAWGKEKVYLKIVSISSLLNLILNFILIPKFGINAAAITTVISEILNFILMRKVASSEIKITYSKYFIKIIPSVLVMILFIKVFSPFHVLIKIIGTIIVYFISILVFRYISIEEIKKIIRNK
nr:flippase [Hathewaya massiliensis]